MFPKDTKQKGNTLKKKKNPYKDRVNTRTFLNLPGFHDGAYVMAYVEDTSERGLENERYGKKEKYNPRPRMILEIADCSDRIELEFDVHSDLQQLNSLHKIDTLIAALQDFRGGLIAEGEQYDRREKLLKKAKKNKKGGK